MPMRSVASHVDNVDLIQIRNTENLAQHARNIQERETQEVDEKEVSISEKQKSDRFNTDQKMGGERRKTRIEGNYRRVNNSEVNVGSI